MTDWLSLAAVGRMQDLNKFELNTLDVSSNQAQLRHFSPDLSGAMDSTRSPLSKNI